VHISNLQWHNGRHIVSLRAANLSVRIVAQNVNGHMMHFSGL